MRLGWMGMELRTSIVCWGGGRREASGVAARQGGLGVRFGRGRSRQPTSQLADRPIGSSALCLGFAFEACI